MYLELFYIKDKIYILGGQFSIFMILHKKKDLNEKFR